MPNTQGPSGFKQPMTPRLYANVTGDVSLAGTVNLEGAEYHQTISFLKEFLNNQVAAVEQNNVLLSKTVLVQEQAGIERLQSKLDSMLANTKIVAQLRQNLGRIGGSDKAKLYSDLKTGIQPIVKLNFSDAEESR